MKLNVTQEMIIKWKMLNYDWMYYKVSSEHPFTYHHLLIPRTKQREKTVENGSILCGESAHSYIHIIEKYDPDRYNDIKLILREINLQGFMTTPSQYKRINEVLTAFERENCSLTNNDGKPIIKASYLMRGIH